MSMFNLHIFFALLLWTFISYLYYPTEPADKNVCRLFFIMFTEQHKVLNLFFVSANI